MARSLFSTISVLPDRRVISAVRIAIGQWYSEVAACDQCSNCCRVKLWRGWTGFFARQRSKDRRRHGLCVDRPRLETASGKHCAAFVGKLPHRGRPSRLIGRSGGLHGSCNGCSFQLGEPVGEFLSAAVVATQRLLAFTVACPRYAANAHMKMIIVVPPWSNLGEPRAVVASLLAQQLLNCRMHEDAVDLWIRCRTLDELGVKWGPLVGIDGEWIFEHRHGDHVLPLLRRENPVRHGGPISTSSPI
jgi:hypothetical protein